jgi:Pyruvate/2-oxoacid:ferredoxin oxidoreductase delta subunit
MLVPLFNKGLIFKSQKPEGIRYYRVRHVMQFHDATALAPDVARETLDLWKEYMDTEWHEDLRMLEEALPHPVMRVVPVNVSIDSKAQILAFDDVRNIVEGAKNLAVTQCACRVIDGKCGKPLEVCMQVNRAADYVLERGIGRKLTVDQAIEMLKACEEEGLVHISDNRRGAGHVICNCCSDCCICCASVAKGSKKFVAPSRFVALVDAELCSGCEVCLDRCFFGAASMTGKDGTAVIDHEKCMGCGVCAVTCPTEAISLKETRPEDFVPA